MDLLHILLTYGAVLIGLLWAIINAIQITKIKLEYSAGESQANFKQEQEEENTFVEVNKMAMVESIGFKIEKGAYSFLKQEYCTMTIFAILFGVVVLIVVDFFGTTEGFKPRFFAFSAFLLGCVTSMICGWIGLAVAVKSNYRTTYMAT